MKMEILKDSEELGRRDYREVAAGVFVAADEGLVAVFDHSDAGVLIETSRCPQPDSLEDLIQRAIAG